MPPHAQGLAFSSLGNFLPLCGLCLASLPFPHPKPTPSWAHPIPRAVDQFLLNLVVPLRGGGARVLGPRLLGLAVYLARVPPPPSTAETVHIPASIASAAQSHTHNLSAPLFPSFSVQPGPQCLALLPKPRKILQPERGSPQWSHHSMCLSDEWPSSSDSRPGTILPPRGHSFGNVKRHFGCHIWERGCSWHLVGRGQGCHKTSYNAQTSPYDQELCVLKCQ